MPATLAVALPLAKQLSLFSWRFHFQPPCSYRYTVRVLFSNTAVAVPGQK